MTVFVEKDFETIVKEQYYDLFQFYKEIRWRGRPKNVTNRFYDFLCLDTAKRFADHGFEIEFHYIVTKYPHTRAELKVTKDEDSMFVIIESFVGNHSCRRILRKSLFLSKFGLVTVAVPEKVFVNTSEARRVKNLPSVLRDYQIGFLIAPWYVDFSMEGIRARIPGVYCEDYVLCPVPGCKDFERPMRSLGIHLQKVHGISSAECRKLYPNVPTIAKCSHDAFSVAHKAVIERQRTVVS